MDTAPPPSPRKGRGAVSNASGRFETLDHTGFDDGWNEDPEADDAARAARRTLIRNDASRRVLSFNTSPDIPFDRSVNPYRGCEHGCVYCFARPTHAYLGLSPGLDFETRIFAKPDAAKLLEKELRKPGYICRPIAFGTNTDPYQPAERARGIMRAILQMLARHSHPLSITTKSALVSRDIDILAPMAKAGLVSVALSVTTLDAGLHQRLEPRAPRPDLRLATIRRLSKAGIPTVVMAAPMIPALNDHELENILEAAAAAGATQAAYTLVRLPLEVKELFAEWLQAHAPLKADHVMNLIRDARGGKRNDSTFGRRMRGTGAYADLLAQRFALARKRFGLDQARIGLDVSRFHIPPTPGDQLSLL